MKGVFLLAVRFIVYHRVRSVLLAACLTLNLYLPCAVRVFLGEFQEMSMDRARATPLVIGAKGSRFALVIHSLHFRGESPEAIPMRELNEVRESGLAEAIPLFVRFRARGNPIIGTSPEYFAFRELEFSRGSSFGRLGDCVLGSRVATRLGTGPGGELLTDSENVFDIAGPAPLNLRVAGVLAPARTADDDVVFVDVRTAWVLQGIGHGHESGAAETGTDGGSSREASHRHGASRANLKSHSEVTDENVGSFHFHGSEEEFPLTALIAVPKDAKSEALLMGRYLSPESRLQVVKPSEVVEELLGIIFKVRRLFDLGTILLSIATVLLVALVIALSLRLRKRELETMFKLGCGRCIVFWLQAAEMAIVAVISVVLTGLLLGVTKGIAANLIGKWVG